MNSDRLHHNSPLRVALNGADCGERRLDFGGTRTLSCGYSWSFAPGRAPRSLIAARHPVALRRNRIFAAACEKVESSHTIARKAIGALRLESDLGGKEYHDALRSTENPSHDDRTKDWKNCVRELKNA